MNMKSVFPILGMLCVTLFQSLEISAAERPLFDGKTLAGWEGNTNTWRVEEGMIVAGSLDRKQPHNEFLATTASFGNFDLKLKIKLEGTEGFVNSGIQFHSKRVPNHHEVSGYQADFGKGYFGALYDESRRNKILVAPAKEFAEKAVKVGEWNDYRIRAENGRVQLWLNGIQTVDYKEPDAAIAQEGILALQIHGGAKAVVRFKDIAIEELTATP